jgi:hypothetical protein
VINLDWVSINQGGAIDLVSGDLKMGVSIAQPVASEVSAGNMKLGLGFWYGGTSAGNECVCSFQSDYDGDGFVTTLDLSWLSTSPSPVRLTFRTQGAQHHAVILTTTAS